MPRPLSPHIFIYRFGYTMSLSILHRFTGLTLSLGFILLGAWLTMLSLGESHYQWLTSGTMGLVLRVGLALWLVAFLYHLANGLRHLFWDAGLGLERAQARRSAMIVLVTVAIAALLLLYAFWVPR
ncbi:MAG: succinate dehydrogenase, cytochrome b556 subunit [Pseudomonadota bacterium]